MSKKTKKQKASRFNSIGKLKAKIKKNKKKDKTNKVKETLYRIQTPLMPDAIINFKEEESGIHKNKSNTNTNNNTNNNTAHNDKLYNLYSTKHNYGIYFAFIIVVLIVCLGVAYYT
jgi:hypothetical protein